MKALSLKDVWLKYRVEFKEHGKIMPEDFWALKQINLDVEQGECICIIGENGAGKTSILKLIAGMLKPDKGNVEVNGVVSNLMDIGAGFQKDLTGSENIYLVSSLFGFSKKQVDARFEEIVRFADIGRFINAPVRIYSQGMYMRLAFSIAMHVDPDILLIDDIFSVGDVHAQKKCMEKMFELRDKGKTIIFVSHDTETAKSFCERGICVHAGQIVKDAGVKELVSYYRNSIGDKRGIGALEAGNLAVTFNNGKLILSLDGETITKEWGGHTSVLSGETWHPSLQADWDVVERRNNEIVVVGKYWDLPLCEVWRISMDGKKGEIGINITTETKGDFDLQEYRLCFMFREDYSHWFDPFEKKCFEINDFNQQLSWSSVNNNFSVNYIGLSALETSPSLPSVVFEDNLYLPVKCLQVYNTDRAYKARALQSRIVFDPAVKINTQFKKYTFFDAKIKIFADCSSKEAYCNGAIKTMTPKAINNSEGLSLSINDNNRIDLFYKNKKITSGQGFKTKLYFNGKFYHCNSGTWIIHKLSENKIKVNILWPGLPVAQIWFFEFPANNLLSWKVYADIVKPVAIKNNKLSVILSPDYNEWFNNTREGKISGELGDAVENICINNPYMVAGLKASLNEAGLPAVLLHSVLDRRKFMLLQRKADPSESPDGIEPILNLSFLNIDAKESADMPKGVYLVSELNLLVGDEPEQARYVSALKENVKIGTLPAQRLSIENGEYRLSFDNGIGRVFFRGREITNKLAMHTAVFSDEFVIRTGNHCLMRLILNFIKKYTDLTD